MAVLMPIRIRKHPTALKARHRIGTVLVLRQFRVRILRLFLRLEMRILN